MTDFIIFALAKYIEHLFNVNLKNALMNKKSDIFQKSNRSDILF